MNKITIYKGGEPVAIFKDVDGVLMQKSGLLEICSAGTWIYFEPGQYDWFDII